jgi:hypothetical protein
MIRIPVIGQNFDTVVELAVRGARERGEEILLVGHQNRPLLRITRGGDVEEIPPAPLRVTLKEALIEKAFLLATDMPQRANPTFRFLKWVEEREQVAA